MQKVPIFFLTHIFKLFICPTTYQQITMKKHIALLSFLLLASTTIHAQLKTKQANWQQEVNYVIMVELDDQKHMLNGEIEIEYINNSPDPLDKIYFHLWPNAYKNNETAFAKQFLENGSTDFQYAKDSLRGFIDMIDFQSDGNKLSWDYDKQHIDIAVVTLANPLKSGEKISITTPFRVKIPGDFSRLGHEGQSYQITQWYPKPAVYDVNGWNAMPYLNQGEFYSEFGSFDVSITLPENYFVAATGVLQNEEEWKRIKTREKNPKDYDGETPVSSTKTKTIQYKQDNVHDFAWFADKTFNIKSSSVTLESGRKIKTFTFDPDLSDMVKHVDEAVEYYSRNIGEYPYDYCTAVSGQLSAGGGMEYPMVTVISVFNQEVIVHEVGHNWFYGILGSDERRYPWMDEAINSFFEWETIQNEKGKLKNVANIEPRTGIMGALENINDFSMQLLAIQGERTRTHQAINCHSAELTSMNYGVIVYGKGSLVFKHLKAYLGNKMFDRCFHEYFDTWKFRHPLPGDIKASFEQTSGKDLSWFFDEIIGTENRIGFSISQDPSAANRIIIHNTGEIAVPVPFTLAENGLTRKTYWLEPFENDTSIVIENIEKYDMIKVDAYQVMFESNTRDNSLYLGRNKPKALKLGFGLEDPQLSKLNWLPVFGYNIHDGGMLGLAIHNVGFPSKNTEFSVTPMYGFNSEELTGYAHLTHHKYPKSGKFSTIVTAIQGARFSFVNPLDNENYSYNKIKPYVVFKFRRPNPRNTIYKSIGISYNLQTFTPQFDVGAIQEEMRIRTENDSFGRKFGFEPRANQQLVDVIFKFQNKRTIDPFDFSLHAQYGMSKTLDENIEFVQDDFLKLQATANYFVNYPIKNKGLQIRAFAGTFVNSSDNSLYHYRLSSEGGKWDYAKDRVLMGRGAREGMFNHQLLETEAQLKNSGVLANVDSWIVSVNAESGLPFKLPIGVYMDLFTFNDFADFPGNEGDKFGYTGGAYVNLGSALKIYIPLFDSPFLADVYTQQNQTNFTDRIVFRLNLNPWGLVSLKTQLAESKLF